jgi:outer membrane protein TolC
MHNKLLTHGAICCVAIVLGGCSTAVITPPAAPPLPAAWQGAAMLSQAPASPAWADAQLIALQNQALTANRDIARAALRWQQAQRLAAQAELRWQPSLGANATANRPLQGASGTRSVEVGGVSIPVSTSVGWSRSYGASAGAGFELDLWDRLAHTSSAQQAQAEAARTDINAARATLLSQVAERYWTAAAQQAQLPLAQQQARLAQEIVQLTTLRVREGKLTPIEIDKASTALLADQLRQADLAADTQLQRHQLALLLDQSLPGPELLTAQLPSQEPPRWALAAPAEVLARRPDVQRARLSVDAALARQRAGDADRYPRLSFSAGVSTGGGELRQWLSQPLASLAANLVVPIVDWRRLELQRDSARSDVELAALALRETLNKSLVEIEAQLIERQRLQQQGASQEARLNELRQAERIAQAKYNEGSLARLDWLQAQHARLGGEQERLQLQLRRWLNHVAMYRVLGLEMGEGTLR